MKHGMQTQAWMLMADDIMDNSETRRGQPCWYKTNDLGPRAFNDALIIEHSVYFILRKYFGQAEEDRKSNILHKLNDLFLRVVFKTCFGQALDLQTSLTSDMSQYVHISIEKLP